MLTARLHPFLLSRRIEWKRAGSQQERKAEFE